jgi:lipoprotein-releasing system permease protein
LYEAALAWSYLVPRRRRLSVALISLLSLGVIALVTWLVLVFLSVTRGMERHWTEGMVALSGPVRIEPTPAYYQSYFYRLDGHLLASGYTLKTLSEKLYGATSSYDPELDGPLPVHFPDPLLTADGSVRNLVGELQQMVDSLSLPGVSRLHIEPRQQVLGQLRLRLVRDQQQSFLTQPSLLLSAAGPVERLMLPPTALDLQATQRLSSDIRQDAAGDLCQAPTPLVAQRWDRISDVLDADQMAWRHGHCSLWQLSEGDADLGAPILVSKEFRDHGVRLLDRGYVGMMGATVGAIQEQRSPVYVAGFYDPGLTPYGSRQVITSERLTGPLLALQQSQGLFEGDSLLVHFEPISAAPKVCEALQQALNKAGLAPFWSIRNFADDPALRPFIEQFRSDRTLLLVIALLMLLVSASNILAMLLLLIHDKKREIAILQAMGARRRSIAWIFALCGLTVGTLGGLLGTLAAWLTLHNIDRLVALLSWFQGHPAFQSAFYGAGLPSTIDSEALTLVLCTTALLSLIAALIPAYRASRLSPAQLLREPT